MYEIVRFNESYKKISLGRPTFIYHFPGVPKNQKAEMADLCREGIKFKIAKIASNRWNLEEGVTKRSTNVGFPSVYH